MMSMPWRHIAGVMLTDAVFMFTDIVIQLYEQFYHLRALQFHRRYKYIPRFPEEIACQLCERSFW